MKQESRRLGEAGFTLIELMIVVAIIGLLASIAIPRYQNNAMKARQSEAMTVLSAVYTNQIIYKAENSTYGGSEAAIGMSLTGNRIYSPVIFANVTTSGFDATITANLDNDPLMDIWTLTAGSSVPVSMCNDITDQGPAC